MKQQHKKTIREYEEKWLDQINENEQVDEYIQAVLAPIARGVVAIGRGAAKAASAAAKGVARGAKAVGRGAKNVAKKAKKSLKKKGSKLKDKLKQKVKDKIKDKMKDKAYEKLRDMQRDLGDKKGAMKGRTKDKQDVKQDDDDEPKSFHGATKSKYLGAGREYKMKNQLREQLRKRIAFMMLESEGGEGDTGDGKKLSPELAKAVKAELEGKTVKSKAGKEIKVTSAMNPSYKEREPATYKKAKAMFSKALEKVVQDQKKGSGKDDPKKDDPKQDDPKQAEKQRADQERIEKEKAEKEQQAKTNVAPKSFDYPPKNLTPEQLKAEIVETGKKFQQGESEVANAKEALAKIKTTGSFDEIRKAEEAVQQAKQDRFDAHVNKANAVARNFESITIKEDELKKQFPNPFSSERREGLKKLQREKDQVLKDSGMTTDEITQMQAQKHMKDHYDQQIDPTNSEGQTTIKIGEKEFEIANTEIDDDGNVSLKTYVLDDDGNKIQNEDGEYQTQDIPASEAWNKDETEGSKENKEDSEFDWDEFWENQTDFAGHDYDSVFGDTDSSGYVNSGYVGKGKLVEKVDIKKHGKFGQTGVPFPQEEPNEFAYTDFAKYAKKNEKKIKAQLSKLRDDRIFKVMEMIWTVWDKKTNKGAFSNIRGNKFGRSLVKMLWDDNIIFNNKSHKITQVKEASGQMPKGKWIRLSGKALDKFRDELIDLITIAYKPIGGHANFKSAGDIQGSGHLWHAVDLDDDPSPDAVNIYKYRSAGTKSVGLGHDGSGKAKSSVIKNKVGNLKKQPFYAEVSGKMYKILKAKGVPIIDDEQIVRDVLKGKDIKWHGNGWYTRSIGGSSHKKIMMGFPKS